MGNKKTRRGGGHRFTLPFEFTIDDEFYVNWAEPVPTIGGDEEESNSESDSDDSLPVKEVKPCGVSHLIETHNPNRTGLPPTRENAPLNRREREALKDPLANKSKFELEQDFVRLQLVRREREEKERKIQEEKKAKEAAKAAAAARAQALLDAKQNKGKRGGHKPGAKIGKNKVVAVVTVAGSSTSGSANPSEGNSGTASDTGSHK
ncbi:unnamed protein product [Hymenolepis diminuta]|uniref:Casein kinase substrate phosphoprotein PP28 domain-containing protein n=1 Tax=Hymenolepis diminuta TaxID=6216 RepID=A0A564Y1G3_HYMDI|nr:unnamed protein product [Hymenolepis diminuta]